MLFRHAEDIVGISRTVGYYIDIRHSAVIEYISHRIFRQPYCLFTLIKYINYLPQCGLCHMYHLGALLTWYVFAKILKDMQLITLGIDGLISDSAIMPDERRHRYH